MPEVSPYIIVALVTVVVCQVLKFAIHSFSNEIDFKKLISSDGSPDTLVGVISAVIASSLAVDGIGSSVAALVLIFGVYFIWKITKDQDAKTKLLSIGIGVLTGLILTISYWRDDMDWLFVRPDNDQIKLSFIAFGIMLVVGEMLSFIARRKNLRKLPTSRKLTRAFRLNLTFPAIIGLFITFAQKETLGIFDGRIWTIIVLAWVILMGIWNYKNVYRNAKVHLDEEAKHFKEAKSKTKSKAKKKKSKRKK